ncbi:NADH-quinone oxidoreductase subunit C [Paracoccus kondratievae]|uniref:NADH-quinone oxidoreductase subunit C n=1 Tax=Paracoccus kondratievae TaxID=135740 RepID=A0AAD3RUK4_9RHOB|nr:MULTISPECIES: NADH-quinone oxidoreductase subunit C [Paracoccus]QFQ86406.1 NADH-quinone oxidoreductase subunit C [Paracoccus kondratievae]GLK65743.1 NADH-quinone oxidoreductase subunit C [Paracoccus kondratievae]SMG10882.1 NADH dehydrogenase subunit C [Paracoccus sp. J56]
MSQTISDETLQELAEHISLRRESDVISTEIAFGELTVNATLSGVLGLIEFLRNDPNCRFSTLIDITAVDNPARPARFDVVYHLLSMYQNQRIRVKVQVREDELVPSLTGVFPGAGWYEREVFDLFGILFSGHPDLRRIVTDYGFRGYPLRKDFPTTGYVEVRWNDLEKRVVYEPVNLVQEYRQFDFLSPWEGAKYVLPGDEKAPEAKK